MKLHSNQPMKIDNGFSDTHSALHLGLKLFDSIGSDLMLDQTKSLETVKQSKDEIVAGSSSAPSSKGKNSHLCELPFHRFQTTVPNHYVITHLFSLLAPASLI